MKSLGEAQVYKHLKKGVHSVRINMKQSPASFPSLSVFVAKQEGAEKKGLRAVWKPSV